MRTDRRAPRSLFEILEPRVLLSADLVPDIPLAWSDADGTVVTAVLTGPGRAEVSGHDGPGNGVRIALFGTDGSTEVLLVAQGGDGVAALSEVSVEHGSLGALIAPEIVLDGVMRVEGTLGRLVLHGARDAAVQADALHDLATSSDFDSALILGASGVGDVVLGTARIGGALSGQWSIGGRAGTVQARDIGSTWRGTFGGAVTSITTAADFSGQLFTPSLLHLAVGGSMTDARVWAGLDPGGDLAPGGTGAAVDHLVAGNLVRLRVSGNISNSEVRVGIDPVGAQFDDGDDRVAAAGGALRELRVGGALDGHTLIQAASLPSAVFVGGAAQDPASLPQLQAGSRDRVAPQLALALSADTGVSPTDSLTRDPSVIATWSDLGGTSQLIAAVNNGPEFAVGVPTASGALVLLGPGDANRPADGPVVLRVRVIDRAGNASAVSEIAFDLDTTAPATPVLRLARTSDDGVAGDGTTSAGTVVVTGETDAGNRVRLDASETESLAAADGSFAFMGVELNEGANEFAALVTDPAGNAVESRLVISRTGAARTDVASEWLAEALEAVRRDATIPAVATRALAMASLAMFDVVNAIEGTPAFFSRVEASPDADATAGVAQAAHDVLAALFPAQAAAFDGRLAAVLDAVSDTAAREAGRRLGEAVAARVLAARANDGWDDFSTLPEGSAPGEWRPTGPAFEAAQAPHWAFVSPFMLPAPERHRPGPPPELGSSDFADAFTEVRALGSASSTTRTDEQTLVARFWADGAGTDTPPGHWNRIAIEAAQRHGQSLTANVRLFALLNVALADASVAAWDAKVAYRFWRPETAIQQAGSDGNAATVADPDWRPLLLSPNHPEYVSGHSTYSAAAAFLLTATFGEEPFETASAGLPGATRSFESWQEAAQEAGRSRIYGGIHFEFSNQAGQALGRAIASEALARFDTTRDTRAPTITLDSEAIATASAENVTIRGHVYDDQSGVARLELARGASGNFVAATVDADGAFAVVSALATDGSDDGPQVLRLRATDTAGNVSAETVVDFLLDTRAPTLSLDMFEDGVTLFNGATLRGQADGTGGPLAALTLSIDDGPARPVAFGTAGDFAERLDLGALGAGAHNLRLLATDSAGHTTVRNLAFVMDEPAPLRVARFHPADDSAEVGVTFRPQVTFTRAIDPSTLTAQTFHAADATGRVLPARIVLGNGNRTAWLFFDAPMPGSSRITVTLAGGEIRTADGSLAFDADPMGGPADDFTAVFSTVSTSTVPGTSLVGRVLDPGPDLKPMTFDDVRSGPDGTLFTDDDLFLLPISNARVHILGREDVVVFTDAEGRFTLTDVPAGNVKVAIDGRTASNPPADHYWPEMVMDVDLLPGVANTVMGTMGSRESRDAFSDRDEVYLPRLVTSLLVTVSDTAPTVIGPDALAAPFLTEEQRRHVRLDVLPGSVVGEDGQPLAGARVGIGTVPPELVRDMLPAGVLQHTFDITIQAPGAAVFATPLTLTLPNVFDAAPGTKLNFLSFDHTTGRLVIEGTATVSDDGESVTTDPGTGITKPGWHGMTPPGSDGGNGPPPDEDPCGPPAAGEFLWPSPETEGLESKLFLRDDDVFELTFENPDYTEATGDCSSPSRVDDMLVRLVLEEDDRRAKAFLDGLESQEFTLAPGGKKTLRVELKDLVAEKFSATDQLLGTSVLVQIFPASEPDAELPLLEKTFYLYRYLDMLDAKLGAIAEAHNDGVLEFADTLVDGPHGVDRRRVVTTQTTPESLPELAIDGGDDFTVDGFAVIFDPASVSDDREAELVVNDPKGVEAGRIGLLGDGTKRTTINVNERQLIDELETTFIDALVPGGNVSPALLTEQERALIDTDPERQAFAALLVSAIESYFSSYPESIGLDTGPASVDLTWASSPDQGDFGIASILDLDTNAMLALLFGPHFLMTEGELSFLVAGILNQSVADGATINIDSHFETSLAIAPLSLSQDEALRAIAKTTAHEIAHTLGLAHTAQMAGVSVIENEFQFVTLSGGAPSDSFALEFNGDSTGALPRNATAALVEAALSLLPSIGVGNVEVAALNPGGPFAVHFRAPAGQSAAGELEGIDVPQIQVPMTTGSLHVDVQTFIDGAGISILGPEVPGGGTDIMAGGKLDPQGQLAFQPRLSGATLPIALHTFWNPSEALATFNLWGQMLAAGGPPGTNGGLLSRVPGNDESGVSRADARVASRPDPISSAVIEGPALLVLDDHGDAYVPRLSFGDIVVTPGASEQSIRTVRLASVGTAPVVVRNVAMDAGDGGAFSVDAVSPGTRILPGESLTLSVRFTPDAGGIHRSTLFIETEDDRTRVEIPLEGTAVEAGADLQLEILNNNAGGQSVATGTKLLRSFATLRNVGRADLHLSSIRMAQGGEAFSLAGLPVMSAASPHVLAPGEALSIDLSFDPASAGLVRGALEVISDDGQSPVTSAGVVGTGIDPASPAVEGQDYVAVEATFDASVPVLRTVTGADGRFRFFLPADTPLHHAIFDPDSGLVAHGWDTSESSGAWTRLTSGVFRASTAPDADNDGLPDDIEFAIGSSSAERDSDADGIDDFTEIRNGTSPLDEDAASVGVIAAIRLDGPATHVAVADSPQNGRVIAAVATGAAGMAFVDVTDAGSPIVIREVDLAGTAADIAFDAARGLAVVAAGDGGLHRIGLDGSVLTIAERTRAVAIADGIVYAAMAGTDTIRAYDLLTAELLQVLDTAAGGDVDALAVDGDGLFALTTSDQLVAMDITPAGLAVRDSLALSFRAGGLFVGQGTAYVGVDDGFNGGFATLDVRNRADLILTSDPDSRVIATNVIVPNGTGLAVGVGRLGGAATGALDIVDVRDRSDTARFLSRIVLGAEADPQDVVLAGGRAFVAGGDAGLLVVTPIAADTRGSAPTVTVDIAALDQDALRSGIQVSEGARLAIPVTIADDVQVGTVEFFLDGERVDARNAFPFDGTLQLPTLRALGRSTLQMSVSATDTGGNTGTSGSVTLELVADMVPPQLTAVNVADGAVKGRSFRTVILSFSEAMDPVTFNPRTVSLAGADGVRTPVDIQFRHGGRQVQFTYDVLEEGSYTLALDRAAVADAAGNSLGTSTDTYDFAVRPFSVTWIRPTGGKWHDPANWSTGTLPGPDDDVLISLPMGEVVVVDFPGGASFPGFPPEVQATDIAIGSIFSISGLRIAGDGAFAVSGTASVGNLVIDRFGDVIFDGATTLGALELGDASLSGTGNVTIDGPVQWRGGTMSGPGRTIIAGDWVGSGRLDAGRVLENTGHGTVTAGLELNAAAIGVGHLVNAAGAALDILDGADVTGVSLLDRDPDVPASFTNLGTLAFRGAGQSDIDVGFTSTGTITVDDVQVRWHDRTAIGGSAAVTGHGSFVFYGAAHDINSGATVTVSEEASVDLASSPDVRIDANATIAGPGTVRVQSGTLRIASDQTLGILALEGGVLRVAPDAELSATGGLNWFSGTITGGGRLVVPGELHIGTPGRTGGTPVLDGRAVLENRSVGTLHPQVRLNLNSGTDPGAGTFINATGAVLTLDAGDGASPLSIVAGNAGPADPATAALFDNRGILRKTGTATANIGTPWTTTGTVDVTAGELSLSGSSTLGGTLRFAPDASLSLTAGSHELTPEATLDTDAGFRLALRGSGEFVVAPEATLALSGHVDISGTGRLAVAGTLRTATLALATGAVDIAGALVLSSGDSTWTGGRLAGGGTLTVAEDARLTIGGEGVTRSQLLGALTIVNEGTLIDAGHRTGLRVELDGNAVVDNRGTFEVRGAGEWNHQATPTGALTLLNTGVITKPTGPGTFTFLDTTLESAGAISVQLGTLRFPGSVNHSGSTQIASGAALVLGAQTIAGPFPQAPLTPFAALRDTGAQSDVPARKQRERTGRDGLRTFLGALNQMPPAPLVDWAGRLDGWRWRTLGTGKP